MMATISPVALPTTTAPPTIIDLKDDAPKVTEASILVQEVLPSPTESAAAAACPEEASLLSAFEAAVAPGIITTQAITTCLALTSYYETQSAWVKSVEIYRRVLTTLWPDFEADEASACTLPPLYADVIISTATKLAVAYKNQRRTVLARQVYLNLFRSCRDALPVDSAKVFLTMEMLAVFYRDTRLTEDLVGLYEEMLHRYEGSLGMTHKFTTDVRNRMRTLVTELRSREI